MTQVSLVGLGLIGGSLGKSLRRVKRRSKRLFRVTGWGRSNQKLKKAKSLGALDHFSTNPKTAIGHADIVVIGVPVQHIRSVAKKILPYMKPGSILTDVGSVKRAVLLQLKPLLNKRKQIHFVGAHPIAGSEKSGVRHATSDLFRGSHCVITTDLSSSTARKKISKMWADVGMKVVTLSAKDHDKALAITSHLPHLISFSLKKLAHSEARKTKKLLSLVGGSYRDMTRVADSDPSLWTGIFRMNKKELKKVTQKYNAILKRLSAFK